MFTGIFIMAILLAGFVVLLRQACSARHPLLQRLREKGIRPGRTELLLCRRPSFVSAGQLMTEREQRFLRRLDRVTDTRHWRLCPQVRVAPDRKSGSREWWQLFRLVSQWHCDVVITDRTHQAPKRQRRDLMLEEVLKQAGIPLLWGDDEQQLAERIREHLCAQRPEGTT
ncbi:DUF2726 domain-containing protein [Salmonella enterica subsp. enterica serovar Bovismorbificans]|nr:DUF2726 domain-containing protein [Salmonella enterica subsp. enterica serovar Bovismorbificans]